MTEMLFSPWEAGTDRPLPSVEVVGGKGYGLYWLAAHGFPTPPTWVLSTEAFALAVQRMELEEVIAALEQPLIASGGDWARIQQTLDDLEPRRQEVMERLAQSVLPEPVGRVLEKLVLMPTQWAVRSSATVEDRPGSFSPCYRSPPVVPSGTPFGRSGPPFSEEKSLSIVPNGVSCSPRWRSFFSRWNPSRFGTGRELPSATLRFRTCRGY